MPRLPLASTVKSHDRRTAALATSIVPSAPDSKRSRALAASSTVRAYARRSGQPARFLAQDRQPARGHLGDDGAVLVGGRDDEHPVDGGRFQHLGHAGVQRHPGTSTAERTAADISPAVMTCQESVSMYRQTRNRVGAAGCDVRTCTLAGQPRAGTAVITVRFLG